MTSTWTDVRNPMDVATVESCWIIKTYGLSCMESYDKIIKNHSSPKNVHKTQTYTMTAEDKT
jgi:hypothetical protein